MVNDKKILLELLYDEAEDRLTELVLCPCCDAVDPEDCQHCDDGVMHYKDALSMIQCVEWDFCASIDADPNTWPHVVHRWMRLGKECGYIECWHPNAKVPKDYLHGDQEDMLGITWAEKVAIDSGKVVRLYR